MCDPTNQIEKTGQDAQAIAYTHAITCVIKKKQAWADDEKPNQCKAAWADIALTKF